ncbi:MAG: VTT domain-containing protein [Verrucomicrobia bacterium]|nr:VTT domain-containing protein [Verrucomicrobiota bacterium]
MNLRLLKATIVLALVLLNAIPLFAAEPFDHSHSRFDRLLRTRVKDGLVDYAALKAAPADLDACLDAQAAVTEADFRTWKESDRLAFLINLYNAQTLRLILDHYPVRSIKNIGTVLRGPWKQPVVRLFGQSLTLNDLEHGIIRKDFHEPAVHFALVCAAKGCPPLREEAYVGSRLEAQLNDQTRRFLDERKKNSIDFENKTLRLSPIFKWYAADFEKASGSVHAWLQRLFTSQNPQSVRVAEFKIEYTDYDWSLNNRASKSPDQSANHGFILRTLDHIDQLGRWGGAALIATYVIACIIFIPGSILTLGAGVLFGVVWGSIYVSIGSTLGATCSFLIGRHLARDWVARKLEHYPQFNLIDRAVAREGWKIVLLARLSPLFPFNLLNYALGLTRIPLSHYILASWIGMIPGTVMYVYLGSLVGSLASLGQGGHQRTTAEWTLYGVGLLATVVVTIYVTRIAKKALSERVPTAEV